MIQDRKLCVRTVGLVVFCLAYFVGAAPVMAQQLKLFPAQGPQSGAPTPFLDACFNLSQWAYPRAYTTHLGVYDRILADTADSLYDGAVELLQPAGYSRNPVRDGHRGHRRSGVPLPRTVSTPRSLTGTA